MPLISVIIPTYQRAHAIGNAIESVYAQTFQDWEIVVVDDGSTDGTEELLKQYAPRVRYFRQENRGPSAARNYGIREACGEWIAFLDSDDIWLPEKLSRQLELAQADLNIAWVYSDLEYFDHDPSKLPKSAFAYFPPARGMVLKHLFLHGCAMHTTTVIVKKTCFDEVGYFDESLRITEDIDLYFRLAAKYPVDFDPTVQIRFCRETRPPAHTKLFKYKISAEVKRRVLQNNPGFAESLSRQELRHGYLQLLLTVVREALQAKEYDTAKANLSECQSYGALWPKLLYYQFGYHFPRAFFAIQQLRQRK
jgi:glycosyltransferase involved in cell wall biosynthesis